MGRTYGTLTMFCYITKLQRIPPSKYTLLSKAVDVSFVSKLLKHANQGSATQWTFCDDNIVATKRAKPKTILPSKQHSLSYISLLVQSLPGSARCCRCILCCAKYCVATSSQCRNATCRWQAYPLSSAGKRWLFKSTDKLIYAAPFCFCYLLFL